VRVVPCLLLIVWLSLGTTGCSLFQKKPKEGDAATKSGGREPAKFPTSGGDPIRGNAAAAGSTSDSTTILAGTVLDEYNNRPKEAYISWVSLDESKKNEAPIDLAVGSDGYFTIRGLKSNQHYKLMARAKEGSRMLAGVTYAKAPDIHVLIRMRADFANSETPPIPGAPAYTPKKPEEPKKSSARPTDPPGLTQTPSWGPGDTNPAANSRPALVPDLPSPVSIPTPAPSVKPAPVTPSGGWMPGIAQGPGAPGGGIPVFIPSQDPPVKIAPPVPLPVPPSIATTTRVPSCVLVGNRLINFALYDLNHQPWEYKTHKRGKLVLLDFWGTWCVPCKQTVPELVKLQGKYGTDGLEIVGLAYEEGGSFAEQARRVNNACQASQVNYRILLGGEGQCPVRGSFAVRFIPTLVLIDENGWILWRHEGRPDRSQIEELEFLIKRQLGIRP